MGEQNPIMPARSRDAYLADAQQLGDTAEQIVIPNTEHFEVIAPISTA